MTTLSASRVSGLSGPRWTSVDLGVEESFRQPEFQPAVCVWVLVSDGFSMPFVHVRHGEAPNSKDCHSSNGTLDRCTEGSPMEVSGWWVMLPGPSRYAEIMAERERANTAGFVKKKATKKN